MKNNNEHKAPERTVTLDELSGLQRKIAEAQLKFTPQYYAVINGVRTMVVKSK